MIRTVAEPLEDDYIVDENEEDVLAVSGKHASLGVQLSINGVCSGIIQGVVDTGANIAIIGKTLAKELNIQMARTGNTIGTSSAKRLEILATVVVKIREPTRKTETEMELKVVNVEDAGLYIDKETLKRLKVISPEFPNVKTVSCGARKPMLNKHMI